MDARLDAVHKLAAAIVAYAFIPLWFLILVPLGPRFAAMGRRLSEARDSLDTAIAERLGMAGIVRVKAFGKYIQDLLVLRQRQGRIRDLQLQTSLMGLPVTLAQSLASTIAPAVVVLVGGWLIIEGECTIGILVTFLGFLSRVYSPVAAIAGLQMQLVTISGILQRVMEILDIEQESSEGGASPSGARLSFNNVSFSYPV